MQERRGEVVGHSPRLARRFAASVATAKRSRASDHQAVRCKRQGPGRSHLDISARLRERLASAHDRSSETAVLQKMSDAREKLTTDLPVQISNRKRSRS